VSQRIDALRSVFSVNLRSSTADIFGYKVYDPSVNPDAKFRPWVPFQQKFMWKQDVNFDFGIGYPF